MAKKSTTQPGPAAPVAPPTPITWPAITKPTTPLVAVTLYPGLVLVDDFFSAKTVSTWLTFLTSPSSPITFEPSPPGPPNRGYAARSNDRFGAVDEEFSRRLWEESGLREICEGALVKGSTKKPVGLNPNIRLYRYFPSALFGPHYDEDYFDPKTKWKSEWTLLIYLSGEEDGVEGGATAFYPPTFPGNSKGGSRTALAVPLKRGRAVLHKHGRECMLHEGRVVEKGVKWVLRSDVMFK